MDPRNWKHVLHVSVVRVRERGSDASVSRRERLLRNPILRGF